MRDGARCDRAGGEFCIDPHSRPTPECCPMSGRLHGPAAWLLVSITAAMMIFILAPLLVTIATSISNTQYIIFPPRGFTVAWYGKALQDQDFLSALWFSTILAVAATAGALLLGVPAAVALARSEFPGRDAIGSGPLSPLFFSVVSSGV